MAQGDALGIENLPERDFQDWGQNRCGRIFGGVTCFGVNACKAAVAAGPGICPSLTLPIK